MSELEPETLGEDIRDNNQQCNRDNNQQCKRKQFTDEQRQAILQALLQSSENRILRRGAINDVAALLNVTSLTVSALWKRGIASL
jgi:predicted house-cleaning noncanonical NTP pyrophosphatase (MazG superfamily)